MSRHALTAAFWVVLTTLMMPSVHALDRVAGPNAAPPMLVPPSPSQSANWQAASAMSNPVPVNQISNPVGAAVAPTPVEGEPLPMNAQSAAPEYGVDGPVPQQGYVRLHAPMYPTPRPNIPIWTGSTMITNQAFAPQEMLYPHTYRAIYPPFYHRVKGCWVLTPLGVKSHERWELQGTKVQVKYRSNYPGLLSGSYWHPSVAPHTSTHFR